MRILGIETSCDETAAAVVENGTNLLTNVIASSQALHAKYGGIIPDQAAREQVKSIIPVIYEALSNVAEVDAIAVTTGPGLIGSLLVGVETAKSLALTWNNPLMPVNHLVGHIYANWLTSAPPPLELTGSLPEFPALVLIVSGGHSDLILMKNHSDFLWLGGTRDDAAGECFDKCGRLLGLPYPYGPSIDKAARGFNPQTSTFKITLPRPLLTDKSYDFSFSGLKTAFLHEFQKNEALGPATLVPALAYELQEAISDALVAKTLRAAKQFGPKSILLAGGVAANKRLREKLQTQVTSQLPAVNLFIPPISLCTDNAAYIASAAFFTKQTVSWEKVTVEPGLSLRAL